VGSDHPDTGCQRVTRRAGRRCPFGGDDDEELDGDSDPDRFGDGAEEGAGDDVIFGLRRRMPARGHRIQQAAHLMAVALLGRRCSGCA
jgi:hypothetical protein